MSKSTRRTFLKTTAAVGAGYFVAAGVRPALSNSPNEKPNIISVGVGGKGGGDSSNAARFGNIIAICDVDRGRLASKGKAEGFQEAEQFVDYREMLAKHGENAQIATISTPDHMHAPATLEAMRMGISCYTQKPLTRTIYEARLLAEVAEETGVCTQMGNQGTALDSSREAIEQLRAGVLGTLKEVHVWSNRPVWPQGPDRRMTMEEFVKQAKEDNPAVAEQVIEAKKKEIERHLENLDWEGWLGVAPHREYWPGLYHPFKWRGWWDFGSGALGDIA
ncbi:MAG: Gfo/Idh/MocA family oxidoreductase, partial [Planctomycetota bacterium]